MSVRRTTARTFVAAALALVAVLGAGATPAAAAEIPLTAYLNNIGIAQDPMSGANFDGGGFAYSSLALLAEGVRGGQAVTVDGMTFTWPNRPSGSADNMMANGQVVPIVPPAGATRVGFLGASTNGPVTSKVTFHYTFVDGDGQLQELAVPQTFTWSDWTLNAGGASAHPTNTVAVTTAFRVSGSLSPELVETHVFATSLPIDPSMTLSAIEFPRETRLHFFGLTVL